MSITGLRSLDQLIHPYDRRWIIEFYGDPRLTLMTAHYVMAYRSVYEKIYVMFNIEFGGLDTLYLTRLCRYFNCDMSNIMISRAFKLDDTIKLLKDLADIRGSLVLLIFPYNYLSKDPLRYTDATKVSGLIMRLTHFNQIMIFNTTTRYGRYMPEGGSFHHHIVKIIIRLIDKKESFIAELIKHPIKRNMIISIPKVLLEHPLKEHSIKTLLEWTSKPS